MAGIDDISRPRVAELFAGCGGMAVGLGRAGFEHEIMVEWNRDAARTVAHNSDGVTSDWNYLHADVRTVDWTAYRDTVDVVAGGPPCQPFSMAGKAAGMFDPRDMWPEAIRAVREIRPSAFLFENVRGILRPAFSDYVDFIVASLTKPSVESRADADLAARMDDLADADPEYRVGVFSVDAADYGAPQRRHRVLVAGFRTDLGVTPVLPPPTHSEDALRWSQRVSGDYWHRHGLPVPDDCAADVGAPRPKLLPWLTCRDAFVGLGDPSDTSPFPNHAPQPGARTYPGHTGSPIDQPAKALKAGAHGVPGGENMLRLEDGSVRYFSIRESARLQCLPDGYEFPTAWGESMRQLGNAVPSCLAESFGRMVAEGLGTIRVGGADEWLSAPPTTGIAI